MFQPFYAKLQLMFKFNFFSDTPGFQNIDGTAMLDERIVDRFSDWDIQNVQEVWSKTEIICTMLFKAEAKLDRRVKETREAIEQHHLQAKQAQQKQQEQSQGTW